MSSSGLSGQRVCVTGASRGIGARACEVLSKAGGQVLGIARNQDELSDLRDRLTGQGLDFDFAALDLTATDASQRLDSLFAEFVPDVFVNNAGATRPAAFQDVSLEDFDQVMGLNVRAGFFASQAAVRAMIANPASGNRRAIIHLGSMLGEVALPGRSVYAATKHAMLGLTKAMALDLAPHGIRVNGVAPGAFPTAAEVAQHPDLEAYEREVLAAQAIKRRGRAEDVASLVAFLAGDESSFITGQTINVDGGWIMV